MKQKKSMCSQILCVFDGFQSNQPDCTVKFNEIKAVSHCLNQSVPTDLGRWSRKAELLMMTGTPMSFGTMVWPTLRSSRPSEWLRM